MDNMFSDRGNKQIPKSLPECIEPDPTVSNLHAWAERLENWGYVLFVILIIVGIISTVVDTFNISEVNEDMMFATFITSAITWALYAFIEYCVYHVLALLISALASITQSTIITANVALMNAGREEEIACGENETVSDESTTVADRMAIQDPEVNSTRLENTVWICPSCGKNNHGSRSTCWKCGFER